MVPAARMSLVYQGGRQVSLSPWGTPRPASGMRGSLLGVVTYELLEGGILFCILLHPQCLEWGLVKSSCQSLLNGHKSQLSQVLKEKQMTKFLSSGLLSHMWGPRTRLAILGIRVNWQGSGTDEDKESGGGSGVRGVGKGFMALMGVGRGGELEVGVGSTPAYRLGAGKGLGAETSSLVTYTSRRQPRVNGMTSLAQRASDAFSNLVSGVD